MNIETEVHDALDAVATQLGEALGAAGAVTDQQRYATILELACLLAVTAGKSPDEVCSDVLEAYLATIEPTQAAEGAVE